MNLFLHIPAWNEEENLPKVLSIIPKSLPEYPNLKISVVVTDDGSTDLTAQKALENGALVNKLKRHVGLATAWARGMSFCLEHDADIIINLDADNQYEIQDLAKLLPPLLNHEADMVIGCRPLDAIEHFSPIKRWIQITGSSFISWLCQNPVKDATSGYRALTRQAAAQLNVFSTYTYTLETLLHAERLGLIIASVPVRVNPPTRKSRLVRSTLSYLKKASWTILRILAVYKPYILFFPLSLLFAFPALALGIRFLISSYIYNEHGKIQSLILVAILILCSFGSAMLGLLAELLCINRVLTEKVLAHLRLR